MIAQSLIHCMFYSVSSYSGRQEKGFLLLAHFSQLWELRVSEISELREFRKIWKGSHSVTEEN